ncbi:receptor-type tyrosine-protein phosphatase F-like [Solenopsis invicta]|uniref:receptor-type tyrosine-protein phosphatase F-like n=1 Tax=Solenopsis invicta TaxID=13686 RepID=UPI00193CB5C2|nr:receptor-type tyrosine-protein phosphatase F-like [Solenopsis invicta]
MKKMEMDVLMFLIFVSQVLLIFGNVILMQNFFPLKNKKKFICVSENDGSALVWNRQPSTQKFFEDEERFNIYESNGFKKNDIMCEMNANKGCLESWIKRDWNLTNSLLTPMGPVFDQRWEEFQQNVTSYPNGFYKVLRTNFSNEIKLSFSIRAVYDVDILICNGEDIYRDSCYWIILNIEDYTQSEIQKCVTEVPGFNKSKDYPEKDSKCYNPESDNNSAFEYIWQTFVITWNFDMGKVNLYDTDKIILTYKDEKRQLRSDNNYYVFIRNDRSKMVEARFHIYDFLHTTVENATLTSPVFQVYDEVICVQLLIGLCVECDAQIILRDSTNNAMLAMAIVKGSTKKADHVLPMWQSVTIKNNSINYSNYSVIIQLIPKLNNRNFNPLWAIANVRQCPLNETLRKNVITFKNYDEFVEEQNVMCQKLFYNEHAVVSSTSYMKSDINLDASRKCVCPLGKIGPKCLVSCKDDLYNDYDCSGIQICYEDGCMCDAGFTGEECLDSCDSNTYSYNCKKTCGSCLYNETLSGNRCDTRTGNCNNGCNNINTEFYIPPLCQTSIQKPNAPTLISINETTIWANVSVTWKGEYEEISILYSFVIQEHNKNVQQSWNELFRNMTQVTKYFENMEPGFTYHIRLNLNISGVQIHSDWQLVETKCNPAENFDIKPEEHNTIIDLRNIPNQIYSCPAKWYYLVIHKIDKNEEVVSTIVSSFLYKFQPLSSNTSFNVIISHENHTLFSTKIRTFDGVTYDSDYNYIAKYKGILSATQLALIWKPSSTGEIVAYEINLKVNEYYGCRNLNLPTPDNPIIKMSTTEPAITIQDLHPYTSYSVEVIAHHSHHFISIVKTIFTTKPTEIPSEVFSQLRVENWELLWNPPKNCMTISGPLMAKIVIQGISDAVKDFNTIKYSNSYKINLNELYPKLNGLERYLATLYVVRNDGKKNTTAYQKLEFETPPAAPHKVRNLEIVEIDTRQIMRAMIHLRWQSPSPTHNGKLRNYGVRLNKWSESCCPIIEVPLNGTCELWDDYICTVIEKNITLRYSTIFDEIKVFAYNVNVTVPGEIDVIMPNETPNTTPDAPRNYAFTISNNSVIDLNWLHPWKTGRHLEFFRIQIQVISSNLRRRFSQSFKNETIEYPVIQYMRKYSKRLYLFPSTRYKIHIQAVTVENKSSSTKFVEINTPSAIVFDGTLESIRDDSISTILLKIPSVSNDTQNSMMHIIVKGSNNTCKQLSEISENLRALASVKTNETAWKVAEVSTKELAGGQFRVGDNKTYGNGINCPLKPDFYEIIVIITEQNLIMTSKSITVALIDNVPPMHYEAWLITVPIILFFILTATAYYLYRRKRQQRNEEQKNNGTELMENSHHYESISSVRASNPALVIPTTQDKEEETEVVSLIKVEDFEKYVKQAIQSGLLDKQYKATKQVMKKYTDDTSSDYINATYITGYKEEIRYIAIQEPESNTVTDFWRMIWQENVLIICMLKNVIENGTTNCEQYWPDIDKKMKYGDITVLNEKQNIFAYYSFRTFQVTYGEETRKIEHLHYMAWPDYDVPLNTHSVVTYLKKLLALSPRDGSVVVHYSGVEKTGIIILCDICLRRAKAEEVVDVLEVTEFIRSKRDNMINMQQYLFAHMVLVECLFLIPTTVPCNEMLITRIKELKEQSPALQQRLQDTAWQDKILRQDKISTVYLKKYPASDKDSDYLYVVYVDGVKLQNHYLATQLPIQSTIKTFWRMIADYKVELILMLQPPDLQDPACCEIAPTSGEFKLIPYLHITAKEIVKEKYYTSQKLLLVDNSEEPPRKQYVTIMCLTEWKPGRNQPLPPVGSMVTFWQAAENIARISGPTVTLCHDGITGCGLYLALSFLLGRMVVEKECDVYLAVQSVKRSRRDFVCSLEHLEYLYDAVEAVF